MARFFDNRTASEKKKAAVRILRELLEEEGMDAVQRAYGEAVAEHVEEQYSKSRQVTRSSVQRNCLCRLVNKHCPWIYGHFFDDCITFDGAHTDHILDHTSLWNKQGKPAIYVAQPYGLTLEGMRSIVKVCDANALECQVDGYSWHFPHATLRIQVKRKEPSPSSS